MDQQQSPADRMAATFGETVSAGARQMKEGGQAALDISRAVIDVYAQAASVFRTRADHAVRTGMAVIEAGIDANSDHLSRLAGARNFQDVIQLQMMWGTNQTLAILRELKKIGPADAVVESTPEKHG